MLWCIKVYEYDKSRRRKVKTKLIPIELTDDQSEAVVVASLIESFERTIRLYDDAAEDNSELLEAIKVILQYYMPPDDYEQWSLS